VASIGALEVSVSNPNVIYVGTGESDIRSDLASGAAVFVDVDELLLEHAARLSAIAAAQTNAIFILLLLPQWCEDNIEQLQIFCTLSQTLVNKRIERLLNSRHQEPCGMRFVVSCVVPGRTQTPSKAWACSMIWNLRNATARD